jgi:outer membrane receptor for ferric coprogen and ferric-rhodotorulic acid
MFVRSFGRTASQLACASRIRPASQKTTTTLAGYPSMKNSRYTPRTACVSCAVAFVLSNGPGVAAAQETNPQTEGKTLPKIEVEATESVTIEGAYTAGPTATATGLTLSFRDTPQSISVVTRERMDDQAMTTIGDALRNTTGVSLKPVDRGRNNLSVRGFEVNNFQLDGVPVATGNIGLETTHTVIYERVEVVRGATGLLSGAGDPSAAVNLVRKHAEADSFTGTLSAEVGSWNQRTGTVDLTAPLNQSGSVRARFVASASERDAFIDLENTQYTVFYGVIDADLAENTRLTVGASDQRDKRNGVLWAGLPYWYADGSRTDWSRSKTSATRWNQWDTQDQSVFATLEHRLENRWSVRADANYHRQDENSMLLWMWGDPDRTTGEGMEALPYHYISAPKQTHLDVVASGPFSLFGREHELAAGIMHSRLENGWSNRDPISALAPVGDFNTWDGSYPEPEMGDRYVGSQGTTKQSGAYLATRLQLTDTFKLIGGGRLSRWNREEEAGAWTPAAYEIDHSSVFTPYAGLVYDLGKQISAYASYTDSFKPQTNREQNGSYLDPLTGKSFEVGLKGDLLDGRLNASAAIFRVDQDNFAVASGIPVEGTNEPAFLAAQGVISKGYEIEVFGELAPDWDVTLGWTHYSAQDAHDLDVAVDHPRRELKLFTKYTLRGVLHTLSFGGGLTWENEKPATATNPATGLLERVGQPAYALIDLMTKYELKEQLSLQLNLNNVLDKKYRSGSYWWGAPYTYGEPRRVLLTMDYEF